MLIDEPFDGDEELRPTYEQLLGDLSSAIKALKENEILDEVGLGKGTVVFEDPLFAIWLKSSFDD